MMSQTLNLFPSEKSLYKRYVFEEVRRRNNVYKNFTRSQCFFSLNQAVSEHIREKYSGSKHSAFMQNLKRDIKTLTLVYTPYCTYL